MPESMLHDIASKTARLSQPCKPKGALRTHRKKKKTKKKKGRRLWVDPRLCMQSDSPVQMWSCCFSPSSPVGHRQAQSTRANYIFIGFILGTRYLLWPPNSDKKKKNRCLDSDSCVFRVGGEGDLGVTPRRVECCPRRALRAALGAG